MNDKKKRLLEINEKTADLGANIPMKKSSNIRGRRNTVQFTTDIDPNVKKRLVYVCALNDLKIKNVVNDLIKSFVKEYDENGHRIDQSKLKK